MIRGYLHSRKPPSSRERTCASNFDETAKEENYIDKCIHQECMQTKLVDALIWHIVIVRVISIFKVLQTCAELQLSKSSKAPHKEGQVIPSCRSVGLAPTEMGSQGVPHPAINWLLEVQLQLLKGLSTFKRVMMGYGCNHGCNHSYTMLYHCYTHFLPQLHMLHPTTSYLFPVIRLLGQGLCRMRCVGTDGGSAAEMLREGRRLCRPQRLLCRRATAVDFMKRRHEANLAK